MSRPNDAPAPAASGQPLKRAEQLAVRSALGWLASLVTMVPFLVLWLLVRDASQLVSLDQRLATALNEAVHRSAAVVNVLLVLTDLAGTWTAVVMFALTTAFLTWQRRWRLSLFVAVTATGLAVLIPASKALIGRARPVVDVPVTETPFNESFPSGHAMTALVLWGTMALVVLPTIRRQARPWLLTTVAVLVALIGFTRLALGVHYLSDVLAGYALGAAWLLAMITSFRTWPGAHRVPRPLDPLRQDQSEIVGPVVVHATRWRTASGGAGRLAAAALLIVGTLWALGELVTRSQLGAWVTGWEQRVLAAVLDLRSPELNRLADLVTMLADTRTVLAVALTTALLSVAASHRWVPLVFVTVAVAGEALLYFAVSELVDRRRPEVPDLTTGLPIGASWPSGHVAAAVVLYGSIGVLVGRFGSRRACATILTLTSVAAVAVGLSRIYLAAHYPTDVLAGALLGAAWLLASTRLLLGRPAPPARSDDPAVPPRISRQRTAVDGPANRTSGHGLASIEKPPRTMTLDHERRQEAGDERS